MVLYKGGGHDTRFFFFGGGGGDGRENEGKTFQCRDYFPVSNESISISPCEDIKLQISRDEQQVQETAVPPNFRTLFNNAIII
jgi:hypothetical protein